MYDYIAYIVVAALCYCIVKTYLTVIDLDTHIEMLRREAISLAMKVETLERSIRESLIKKEKNAQSRNPQS